MKVVMWTNQGRDVPGWDVARSLIEQAGHTLSDPGSCDADHLDAVVDADALIVTTNAIPATLLETAERLRIVAKPGIGVDNIDVDRATALGIGVANTPGSNTSTVADHTIGMILAVLRNLVRLDRTTRSGHGWDEWPIYGGELTDATVAVVGTGHIGAAVIHRLVRGFDARVLAFDPFPNQGLVTELGVEYGTLSEILPRADILTVHVPLTSATRGLIGARELASLPTGAVVVNAARGGVVDEEALAGALSAGALAGVAADVFPTEPALSSPLFAFDTTVVTPHIAGYSRRSLVRARELVAENVIAALAGRPVNLINPGVIDVPGTRLGRVAEAGSPT